MWMQDLIYVRENSGVFDRTLSLMKSVPPQFSLRQIRKTLSSTGNMKMKRNECIFASSRHRAWCVTPLFLSKTGGMGRETQTFYASGRYALLQMRSPLALSWASLDANFLLPSLICGYEHQRKQIFQSSPYYGYH